MMNPHTGSDEDLFHGDIGMCFSGSTVNAFALREALYDRVRGLLMPSFTFDQITHRIFEQYVKVSKSLCHSLVGAKGQSALFIAGFCYETQSTKAFKLSPVSSNANDYEYYEILINDGDVELMGSGSQIAKELIQQISKEHSLTDALPSILKQVIENEHIDSVGGRIRYGYFKRKDNFKSHWL
ncbi:hypothetical protein KIH87_00025 [Paraneptunicella aestuarii]|uniref:hypothetical protein n=1 Tax=Paraneptunicella aestuarii TaxID=2831148 RepID=UPI001E429F78|nr:hypothetical protein [Paraneptunicella aestuarii]UAA38805.1 hypothetical protein KIH87_00025 [Paraneptunicella aestuarii]